MTTKTPTHARLICRLPVDQRRAMLNALRPGQVVKVEHHWSRDLDAAGATFGEVVGAADHLGGGSADVLVIRRRSPLGLVAIPAAHVLRVRVAAVAGYDNAAGRTLYRTGEVLAGPPVRP